MNKPKEWECYLINDSLLGSNTVIHKVGHPNLVVPKVKVVEKTAYDTLVNTISELTFYMDTLLLYDEKFPDDWDHCHKLIRNARKLIGEINENQK